MIEQIRSFLSFCGLDFVPTTVGELFYWLVGVFFCMFLIAGIIKIFFKTVLRSGAWF